MNKNIKNAFLIALSSVLLTACGNQEQQKGETAKETAEKVELTNAVADSTVYVYYFHAKKRCKTCNTVEKVAKEAVEANYAGNTNVKFLVLPADDEANKALVEKYEITWNGLIVTKGDNGINITEKAFANAVNTPDVLVDLIKTEVNSRLN